MVLAFLGVLGIGCLVVAAASGFMRHWRLAGEMERVGVEASNWLKDSPAPVPPEEPEVAGDTEPWRVPHSDGRRPREAERQSGPAATGS